MNSNCEKNIKIISYITNSVILKFVPSIDPEIFFLYINICVPNSNKGIHSVSLIFKHYILLIEFRFLRRQYTST